MKTIIAYDPGRLGGVSIFLDGKHLESHPMPLVGKPKEIDCNALLKELESFRHTDLHVVVESVHGRDLFGANSSFVFGKHYGFIIGLVTALQIPHTLVSPRKWQGFSHTGTSSKIGTKERSFQACARLYPTVDLLRGARVLRPHDGIADALLIAHWFLFGRKE